MARSTNLDRSVPQNVGDRHLPHVAGPDESERTREIGLMRAIGMTRRQTKGMIRLEAAVTSRFRALLGFVVGLAFG